MAAVASFRCRTQDTRPMDRGERGNKPYLQAGHPSNNAPNDRDQREKLNPPPPDLWIGHDQLELKAMDGDETGETTLSRSTPDYRSASSMDRSRNYVMPYSGKLLHAKSFLVLVHTIYILSTCTLYIFSLYFGYPC